MLTDPEHCYHERRQAVATTTPETHAHDAEGFKTLNVPTIFVVCLDCGKTEEAHL